MICQQSVAKFESKIYQIGRFNSRRFPEKLNIEAKVDSKMSLKFNFIIKIQDWTLQQLARYLVTYLSTNHLKYLSPEWSLKSDNFSTISTVILFRAVAIIIMVMIGLLQKEKKEITLAVNEMRFFHKMIRREEVEGCFWLNYPWNSKAVKKHFVVMHGGWNKSSSFLFYTDGNTSNSCYCPRSLI